MALLTPWTREPRTQGQGPGGEPRSTPSAAEASSTTIRGRGGGGRDLGRLFQHPGSSAARRSISGQQHVAAVIVSALGRRLFVEHEGDVLHTNVAGYIYGEFL
jgi:hypothetical protein